jgi:hypothetical protein
MLRFSPSNTCQLILLTSPSNESNVKPSITLPIWDVRDIGRKSSSMDPGGDTLGMGI